MHQAPAHRNETALTALLQRIDGAPYPSYKSLKGSWQLDSGHVCILIRFRETLCGALTHSRRYTSVHSQSLWSERAGKEACEDWLLRQFGRVVHYERRGSEGLAKYTCTARTGSCRALRCPYTG